MTADPVLPPSIHVLAGTNGAGKSSVAGAALRARGADYFNPDETTRKLLAANPALTLAEANIAAWQWGRRLLEQAIDERLNLAFETTLGGDSIAALLKRAVDGGISVRIWYVGLATPELHIARVRARVAKGGHDIPEEKIRERYDRSRANLIRLLPGLAALRVFDNSEAGDPASEEDDPAKEGPNPKLVLHMEQGRIVEVLGPNEVPHWAEPIVAAALRCSS